MKNKEIKAIVFDIGGVVWEEDPKQQYPILSKKLGFCLDDFYRIRDKYLVAGQTGKLSPNQYLKKFYFGLNLKNFGLFKKNWMKIRYNLLKKNKELGGIIHKLKGKYILATLTNILSIHQLIRKQKKVYKPFKINLISCREGLVKPNPKFYKLLISRLKLYPEQIVFIDDMKEYLKPAKKLGINVIHFKNNNQLVKDLKKLGVVI